MTTSEYLTMIHEHLLQHTLVKDFQKIRERITNNDGYLRAKLTLTNNDRLEFSEYFQMDHFGNIHVITYSYHWSDSDYRLILRWDNTPHFPDLPNYPYHIHMGDEKNVKSSTSQDILQVIKIIEQIVRSKGD